MIGRELDVRMKIKNFKHIDYKFRGWYLQSTILTNNDNGYRMTFIDLSTTVSSQINSKIILNYKSMGFPVIESFFLAFKKIYDTVVSL